jgi:hypothetical protein
MVKKTFKKYVVIYLSQEHHEVLGYVMAPDIKEAMLLAKEELKKEAEFYEVVDATIAEIEEQKGITFDISQKK